MASRVGIELLPHVCRIVEIREPTTLPGRKPARGRGTRVVAFRELPYAANSPGKLAADLRQAIKKRRSLSRNVTAIIWGLKANHQVILLPPATPEELEGLVRREARGAGQAGPAAKAGSPGARPTVAARPGAAGAKPSAAKPTAWTDGFIAGEVREGGKQEIGYVSTTLEDVRSRLKPLVDAGFEVNTLLTPALSHAAIIRQRRINSPDAVAAVVSFNPHVTAITVLRGQIVLFTRELPWGWEPERAGADGVPGDTRAVAERLAAELRRSFVFVKQQRQVDVGQVLVCGDMPDLRALTGPLMQELNTDVETLDSLEGLDAASLPAPAEEFRTGLPRLRPACAVAAEAEPPINLMPRASGVSVSVPRSTQQRIAVVCAASIALAAAGTYGANQMQASVRTQVQSLRQQIARLEPETQRQEQADQAERSRSLRMAALDALVTQGPRLALVLDAFRRAPSDLAASSVLLVSSPSGTWSMDVSGQAKSPTAADAQASFATFLRAATASPYLGPPSRPPVIKVHIEEAPPPKPKETRTTGSTAGDTGPSMTPLILQDLPPTELPRGVDVLSVRWVKVYTGCDFTGWRKKFTVAIPLTYRRLGLARGDWVARVNAYNQPWADEIPCRGGRKVDARTAAKVQEQAEPEPPAPFVGAVLDFGLHYEVKR